MTDRLRCFLLPGMGATPEMYRPLKTLLGDRIICLPWPSYNGEASFGAVAARVMQSREIRDTDVIGGASLGGMVALEIAKQVDVKAVVLLGSALHATEVNPILMALSCLARFVPIGILQALSGRLNHTLARMFAASEPAFIRAMSDYIRHWPGYDRSLKKIYRIHGRRDLIIMPPDGGSEIIGNGGHLIALYHARRCADFIHRVCACAC